MGDLKILHQCDHRVVTRTIKQTTQTMSRGLDSYDIINLPNIVSIDEVRYNNVIVNPMIYTLSGQRLCWAVGIYGDVDTQVWAWYENLPAYEYYVASALNTNTETTWDYVPAPYAEYEVDCTYMDATLELYNKSSCPKCLDQGWYVAPVPTVGDIDEASGVHLVAQVFLKCLLTVPGTDRLDMSTGAGLLPGDNVRYFDTTLEARIYDVVRQAEKQARDALINRSTENLDELLNAVSIVDIVYDVDNGLTRIVLRLTTMAGTAVTFGMEN